MFTTRSKVSNNTEKYQPHIKLLLVPSNSITCTVMGQRDEQARRKSTEGEFLTSREISSRLTLISKVMMEDFGKLHSSKLEKENSPEGKCTGA